MSWHICFWASRSSFCGRSSPEFVILVVTKRRTTLLEIRWDNRIFLSSSVGSSFLSAEASTRIKGNRNYSLILYKSANLVVFTAYMIIPPLDGTLIKQSTKRQLFSSTVKFIYSNLFIQIYLLQKKIRNRISFWCMIPNFLNK